MQELSVNSWILTGQLPSNLTFDFETLWNLHPSEFNKVKMGGVMVDTPRWQQSYIRGYYFTGVDHGSLPLPEEFKAFFEWSNTMYKDQLLFNQVLINWYNNGNHYIGPHSDDTRPLVDNSPIMSISLGETRTFRIRDKKTKDIVRDIELSNRDYVIMCGSMQQEFTHEIVKVNGLKGIKTGKRINITMRVFKD